MHVDPSSGGSQDWQGVPPKKTKPAAEEGLITRIDNVLSKHGFVRNGDPLAPQQFKVSMHFKHPKDNPNDVIIQTWKQSYGKKKKKGKPPKQGPTQYCVPFEVTIKSADGKVLEKFDYTYKSRYKVPLFTQDQESNVKVFGKDVKKFMPKTTHETKERIMYRVYLEALGLQYVVKNGYQKGADKQLTEKLNGLKKQFEFEIDPEPDITAAPGPYGVEHGKHWRKEQQDLKARNVKKIGLKLDKNDKSPLRIDFTRITYKVVDQADDTFKTLKKGQDDPSAYETNAADINRRIHLVLDSEDSFALATQRAEQRIPPQNPADYPKFKEELEKAEVKQATLLEQWPERIEADCEVFKEKAESFVTSPKLFSFGTFKNLFSELVLKRKGTAKLRSINNEMKKYAEDVKKGRLTGKSKPRSKLGQMEKTKNELTKKQYELEDQLSQLKIDAVNAGKDPSLHIDLKTLKSYPADQLDNFNKDWQALQPTLDPSLTDKQNQIEGEIQDVTNQINTVNQKLTNEKKRLHAVYQEFKTQFKELERIQTSINSRLQWMQSVDEKEWEESFADPVQRQNLQRSLHENFKTAKNLSKHFSKIREIFTLDPSYEAKIQP